MINKLSILLASAAIATGTLATLATAPAFAVPKLQLNSSGGSYISSSEDTTNANTAFTLNAYCDKATNGQVNLCDSTNYFLSIALLSNTGSTLGSIPSDMGSFTFQPSTPSLGATTTFTSSNFSVGTPNGLPTHGVYSTAFTEVGIGSFSLKTASVDVQTNADNNPLTNIGTALFFDSFKFDISNLSSKYKLAIDLYSKNADGSVNINAPFSHNFLSAAGGGSTGGGTTTKVPEPTTILGLGLVASGMVMSRRRRTVVA